MSRPEGWNDWNGHDVVDAYEVFGGVETMEGKPGFGCDWACRRCHLAVGDMETGRFDDTPCPGVEVTCPCFAFERDGTCNHVTPADQLRSAFERIDGLARVAGLPNRPTPQLFSNLQTAINRATEASPSALKGALDDMERLYLVEIAAARKRREKRSK